jgi:glutathione S-transferase
MEYAQEFNQAISQLVEKADPTGPFFLGPKMSWVDVQVVPWFLRIKRALRPYRGFPEPDPSSRLGKWLQAIENDVAVKSTTSTDELYFDSYERYAGNFQETYSRGKY